MAKYPLQANLTIHEKKEKEIYVIYKINYKLY